MLKIVRYNQLRFNQLPFIINCKKFKKNCVHNISIVIKIFKTNLSKSGKCLQNKDKVEVLKNMISFTNVIKRSYNVVIN